MVEENKDQEFRMKNIDDTINHFIKEIKQNGFMSKKHKKVCTVSNYIEHLLILTSAVTGCVSVSVFDSLVGIPVGSASSVVEIKICAITAGIKRYKSIIKKKEKNMKK